MTIGVILALIDLGFCVLVMCYCCKCEKRLNEFEHLCTIKFRIDGYRPKTTYTTIYDADGNLQEVIIDEWKDNQKSR